MKTAKPSSRRPARQASLKPSPLNGYLAGAAGTAALLGAPQAEAAVTAVNFGFGTEFNPSDGFGNFSVGPGFGTLTGSANSNNVSLTALYTSYNHSNGAWGLANFFNVGTTLGNNGNGTPKEAFFHFNGFPNMTFATNQSDKYIGFKTSTNNYGYANVSWDLTAKSLTVHSAFVESVANTSITITAVPEPSRALLALAGFGGLALRRRRKQAA